MGLPEPDMQVYQDELNRFLLQVKQEIQDFSHNTKTVQQDQETLEAFLLDLNTYYYRSFHERFFPLYKTGMEEEIRSLYRISRGEAALKEDILSNLKRMGQIFNGVKNAGKLLDISRDQVQNLLFHAEQGRELRIAELLYTLKDLDNHLLTFHNMLSKWQTFLSDQDLLKSLSEYPFHLALHQLLHGWEAENSRFIRDFKRLMVNLQLAAQLLIKLQYSDDPCLSARKSVLDELHKLEVNLASKKSTPFLDSWYKQHLQDQFLIYTELLGLYADKNERRRCLQIAQTFENWLQALLYLLEKATLSPEELGPLFLDLQSLALLPSELKEISELVHKTSGSLQELTKSLAAATNPEFEHFSTAARRIVADVWPQLKASLEQGKIPSGTVLANGLSRLSMQISLLDMHLDLLNDKEDHRHKLRQQYQIMLSNMDSYQALLTESKNELSRALAPRNISRNFKEMDIRMDHVPVVQGEVFPAAYLHCLPAFKETASEAPRQEFVVREEGGDLFIFRIDDLYAEVIPNIVLASKE